MSALTDMQIWSRWHIARTFGIPPELIGLPPDEEASADDDSDDDA